jgi:hypothetical protein
LPTLNQATSALGRFRDFGLGLWRYWRFDEPAPASNVVVQKLYAFTDGRSNDFLFRLLESRRKESSFKLGWDGTTALDTGEVSQSATDAAALSLKQDGVTVLPVRLTKVAVQSLYDLAVSSRLATISFAPLSSGRGARDVSELPVASKGESIGMDPSKPAHSVYMVPRVVLLENPHMQALLCDPYLLEVATRYLGVFPIITKPDMWWDTEAVPAGLRPRPYHTDSGCLRWLKVGINLTETTFETPHFVYVKGSHNPNKTTRQLSRRLVGRMNLSDKEVTDLCADRIVHITAPAGSITLADTRGIHKGELSQKGNRLILYFGLEGSAFNNIDQPALLNHVTPALAEAMNARPFSYQFLRKAAQEADGATNAVRQP